MSENAGPNFLPHVLVITGDTADEREYEIEHPDECPVICPWWPGAREETAKARRTLEEGGVVLDSSWTVSYEMRTCYVEWEVGNVGLDSLDLGEDPPDDGTYTPASQWSMDGWRRLPAGRYIIEGWHHTGRGLMPWGADEDDGGLNLLGPEKQVIL